MRFHLPLTYHLHQIKNYIYNKKKTISVKISLLYVFVIGVFATTISTAFAEQQEYTLEFGFLLHDTTAHDVEQKYLAIIEGIKSIPNTEIMFTVERITNDCETIKTTAGERIYHNPCIIELESGEYDWIGLGEGTIKSTDRDALLEAASKIHPAAYKLKIGNTNDTDYGLLSIIGFFAGIVVFLLGYKRCTWFVPWIFLIVFCFIAFLIPFTVNGVMRSMTYTNLLDSPVELLLHDTIPFDQNINATKHAEMPNDKTGGNCITADEIIPEGSIICLP